MKTDEPSIDPRARSIWARTRLRVWPEKYYLVSLPTEQLSRAAALIGRSGSVFAGLVRERDEVSLTVEESAWRGSPLPGLARGVDGPFRAITFDVNIDLEVCGYLAPAATLLARAGISIVPQCGYLKDHLLIHERNVDRALELLERFIKDCKEGS